MNPHRPPFRKTGFHPDCNVSLRSAQSAAWVFCLLLAAATLLFFTRASAREDTPYEVQINRTDTRSRKNPQAKALPLQGLSFNAIKTPLPSAACLAGDPAIYQKDLALLSLNLSAAAYSSGKKQTKVSLFDKYRTLGFPEENISLYGYPGHKNNRTNLSWSNEDAYSFAIGHRQAGRVTILLLTFRGTGPSTPYTNSLTDPGLSSVSFLHFQAHNRFYAFYELVMEGLKDHLARHPEVMSAAADGSLRLLITGHSLGAAVANLLGAALTNSGVAGELFSADTVSVPLSLEDSLYVYTFACPRTFHSGGNTMPEVGKCRQIFNILIAQDSVTQVPRDNRLSLDESWMRFGYALTFQAPSLSDDGNNGFSYHSPELYRKALLEQIPSGPSGTYYYDVYVSP